MKLIEFKEFNRENISRALNKRKVAITVIISVIMIIILTFVLLYIYNKNFRNWADMHILMKVVKEVSLSSIDIDKSENITICAYDKYVAIINANRLNIYNSSGKQVATLKTNINNPIYYTNGKYLVVGDRGKQKVYLISGTKILWQTDIEGMVTRVSVNENGYVAVVFEGSTYKSIVTMYDQSGNALFKSYVPTNTVVDSTISSDNKFLSYAEVDTSKAAIESTVKTISVKDASAGATSSAQYTYQLPTNMLITNLRYQGSKNLLCMCDSGIYSLAEGETKQRIDFEEQGKKYSYAGINLSNTFYVVEETAEGVSNQQSTVLLTNSTNNKVKTYEINGIAKATASSYDNIAINLGNEIYFVNTKGWLIKKYVATQEIKDVIVSDRLAAIIFRDKIEILIL